MSNFASGYIKYINHLEQINDAAINHPARMINEVEGSYHDHLKNIARNIVEEHGKVKLIMLAGPSSSGKTTTANMLKHFLLGFGVNAYTISMDNFYKGRDEAPLLPDGSRDYESVDALDVDKIQKCFKDVVKNGRLSLPTYNFALGKPEEEEQLIEIGENDIVIIEGIHALNPVFTRELSEENQVSLYVSVKQQIKDANGEVISPLDLRLVRRIVRDVRDRDTTPEETLSMWESVVSGENNYIRPYRISADYTVNSIHLYEPCVLRTVAIPMLRKIPSDSLNYKKARDLESRLMRFEPIEISLVPNNSMLCEFLGKQ